MKRYDLWDAFAKTGSVQDYLRYRGLEGTEIKNMQNKEDGPQHDDQRPDYQGKQQYW